MISLTLASQWHVFTPQVYRILPEVYVDEFFNTGRLRLSSFKQFATHPDEERGDREGWHILVGKGTKQTVFAVAGHGSDSYVLSATQRADPGLFDRFGSTSAILIRDTLSFGTAIARQLPGYKLGMEGPCVYKDGSIECDIGDFELEQLRTNAQDKTLDLNRLGGFVLNMAGAEVFFRKRARFEHQGEYRWVWLIDREVPESTFVDVPDARQYCEKATKPTPTS